MTKRRREVRGLGVLKGMNLSREERKEIIAAIRELAESDDPSEIAEPVRELPVGTDQCPECGTTLTLISAGVNLPGEQQVDFFECGSCERAFAMPSQ